jgi:hypothetical protein
MNHLAPVHENELVARFILFRGWVRADLTVRPEAFIPYPHKELSVTRCQLLTDQEMCAIGHSVAHERKVIFYGHADIPVSAIIQQSLHLKSAPILNNPNHANIVGWPEQKPAQKIVALQLAASAKYFQKHEIG